MLNTPKKQLHNHELQCQHPITTTARTAKSTDQSPSPSTQTTPPLGSKGHSTLECVEPNQTNKGQKKMKTSNVPNKNIKKKGKRRGLNCSQQQQQQQQAVNTFPLSLQQSSSLTTQKRSKEERRKGSKGQSTA